MNLSLNKKIRNFLILGMSVFSLSLLSAQPAGEAKAKAPAAPQETWTTVSLSQEDTLGANTLLALVRNIDDFSLWLKGKALNDSTQIMVRFPKNQSAPKVSTSRVSLVDESTGEKITTMVKDTVQISKLRYIIAERDEKDLSNYTRVVLVGEEIITKVRTRKEVDLEKGERDVVVSSSVSYNYIPLDVEEQNLDSDSSKMYKDIAAQLWAEDAPAFVEHASGAKIYRVQDAATKLVVAASKKSKEIAALIGEAKRSGKVVLDTTSRKSVSFEESSKGAIRNIVLAGFIKVPGEVLEAPDAVSSTVVKIDQGLNVTIEERKPLDQDKVELKDLTF